ncbi:MAG TPA: protein kinase [Vicinamibacterales bacterium]
MTNRASIVRAEPVRPGTLVSHYRIGDRIGAGGMGEVYRAEDTRLGRTVAVKFLHRGRDEPDERARLLREARAVSSLRSSGIAAIFDLGEHDSRPFIVMELVDGESVAARIARGPLPIAEAVSIAAQAADALDEAHGRGIIHRDVKSANLMVDSRGRVKLLDFGLAKMVDGSSDQDVTGLVQTVAGTVLGTFAYMSPEQIRARSLDARTDLFSLGVVLYEMIAGRLPFDGETAADVANAILNHDPPALARFNYSVPERLEAVVLKALAKDRDFRYQSARELYIDLHAVARLLQQGEDSGRHRTAAVGVAPYTRPDSGPQAVESADVPALAVMTFSNTTRDPVDDWIGSGIAETLTADLKRVRGLSVIGRTQVFDAIRHLSGHALERVHQDQAIDIGRRLGATYIIGGAYQRLGPLIRITAECVDVRSGALIRSVKVDGRVEDIFSLQDRLVTELSEGLNLTIRPSGLDVDVRKETDSVEAWEAFSRGLMNLRLATRESLASAVAQFEAALRHDPQYASAWALLGVTYNLQGQFLALPGFVTRAVEALQRALSLDPVNVYALSGLASAYLGQGRTDEAIAAATRAIQEEPDHLLARTTLARAFWIGKGLLDEGISALEGAVRHNPNAGYPYQQLALLFAIRGDLARAEEAARRAVSLQENLMSGNEGLMMVGSYVRLGYVRYLEHRYEEALALYERERAFLAEHDHALRDRVLIEIAQKQSAACWRKNDRDAADRYFEQATRAYRARQSRGTDDPFTKYYIASLHALRGDATAAIHHLSECLETLPALTRTRARLDPDFDPIREDPGFVRLLSA